MKKEEIIQMLSATDSYVSGQEICEHFGVSRTAVWKAMKQLEKDGYMIEAISNKGYRLQKNDGMMSGIEISRYMDTKVFGKNLVFHKETGSTNLDAKKLAEEGAPEGTLVVADQQNAGRGRRGRVWVSPAGESIYMTVLLRPECEPGKVSSVTLVMALAVMEAVRELTDEECGIKWPNDVVMNKKKVCGILTEMSMDMDAVHYVVIGTGINVNQNGFEAEISQTATSLALEIGSIQNRNQLVARIMYFFEQNYTIYKETYDMEGLVDKYNHFLINRGKEVKVLDPKGEYEGVALGIDNKGQLLVKKRDGEVVEVYAGEVSVRGIYGYV